jgi:hypothetical protein
MAAVRKVSLDFWQRAKPNESLELSMRNFGSEMDCKDSYKLCLKYCLYITNCEHGDGAALGPYAEKVT